MTEGELLAAESGPQTASWFDTVGMHRHAYALGPRTFLVSCVAIREEYRYGLRDRENECTHYTLVLCS